MDSGEDVGIVHDVGFEEDDGAFVDPVGEEIADPDEGVVGDGASGVAWVAVGRETGGFGHAAGDGVAEGEFGFGDALDDAFEGFEALVVEGEFAGEETAVGEDVEVVGGGEARVGGVAAPAVGVEVEAEDEVGFEDGVDAAAAFSDFGGAVEEPFAFAAEGSVGDGGAVLLEAETSGFEEVWRAERSERVVGGADEVDVSAHGFEDGAEGGGGGEGEVAFLDG